MEAVRGSCISGRYFMVAFFVTAIAYFLSGLSIYKPYVPAVLPCLLLVKSLVQSQFFKKPVISSSGLRFVGSYLLAVSLSLMFSAAVLDSYSYRKLLLPLCAFFVALFKYRASENEVFIFSIMIFMFALIFALEGESEYMAFDITQTQARTESIYGIALGAFSAWFFSRGRFLKGWFVFLLCVVLFKRNAILASFAIFLFFWLRANFSIRATRRFFDKYFAQMMLVVALSVTFFINDLFVFLAGLSGGGDEGEISSGRFYIYLLIIKNLAQNDFFGYLFGNGPGAVERMLAMYPSHSGRINLSHNEYLSLFYDFGGVGLVLILRSIYAVARHNISGVAVLVYLLMVFVLENVFFLALVFMLIIFLMRLDVRLNNE